MVSFIEGLRTGLKNAYCSQVAATPQWFSNLRSVLVSPGTREQADNLTRWVCDIPPGDFTPGFLPFEGGQCFGVNYQLDFTARGVSGAFQTTQQEISGRIVGTDVRLNPAQGTQTAGVLRQLSEGAPIDFIGLISRFQNGPSDPSISNLVRLDGQPDDCGDPDPDIPPPGPQTVNVNIDYGDDFSLTVPVIFAPIYVAFNGELRIPVEIGELNFNGEITFSPEFNFEPDFGQGPGDPGNPDPDDGPAPGDETGDEEEEEENLDNPIIGVFVFAEVTGPTRSQSLAVPPAPPLTLPRMAQVIFRIGAAGYRGWTEPQDVMRSASFIYCPVPWGALDFRVSPTPGVEVEAFAVYGKPLQTV